MAYSDPTMNTLMTAFDALLKPRLEAELAARQAAGTLAPVTGLDGYRFPIIKLWNSYVAGGLHEFESYERRELFDRLMHLIGASAGLFVHNLAKNIDDGTFAQDDVETEIARLVELALEPTERRSVTGEVQSPVVAGTFILRFDNWTFEVVKYNTARWEAGLYPNRELPMYLPLAPIAPSALTAAMVHFPSGHLIINDWIHIPAFTAVVNDKSFKINHAAERVRRTIAGLEKHNLIEVACHGQPSVVVDRDGKGKVENLRVGWLKTNDEDDSLVDPTLEVVGKLWPEYWAVTIIDKADLVRILTDAGVADPEADFQAWRTSMHASRAVEIQIPKGSWRLAFIDDDMIENVHDMETAVGAPKKGIETLLSLTREDGPVFF